MSGAVPLLPHVPSWHAQDSLYMQDDTWLLTSIRVPEYTDSAIPVCEQRGGLDISGRSAHGIGLFIIYSQWEGITLSNIIMANIWIKCAISVPTSPAYKAVILK
jgi:hypothetical protein